MVNFIVILSNQKICRAVNILAPYDMILQLQFFPTNTILNIARIKDKSFYCLVPVFRNRYFHIPDTTMVCEGFQVRNEWIKQVQEKIIRR